MSETIIPSPGTSSQPKTSALAIWSLVLGILGLLFLLVCISPLFAIPAVICGHMAYARIKRSSGALAGQGMAVAGLTTGYISIALSVFLVPMMMAIAIPNFVKARTTSQANACINNLRQIDSAKQEWALENKKTTNDVPTVADMNNYLGGGGFSAMRCPAGGTYTIGAVGQNPTCSIPNHKLPDNSKP